MIPTYNPKPFLEETLRSILEQDPGRDQMQIAVVDDDSHATDPEPIVRRLAGDRVTIYRQQNNVGLARNWNTCIERAGGKWVHLMHQDDLVLPGYYQAIRAGVEYRPDVGLAFTRAVSIDPSGTWIHLSRMERASAGIVPDWIERVAVNNRIQCPAVAVRKDVYETLGGFREELVYATDWEMWCRIAARYAVWFDPKIGISYRVHEESETARLKSLALIDSDVRRAIKLIGRSLPPEIRRRTSRQSRFLLANKTLDSVDIHIDSGKYGMARQGVVEAVKTGWRSPSVLFRACCAAARMLVPPR